MATITKNVEDTINEVLETLHDGEKGFHTAADAVQREVLKNELMHFSRERASFAAALTSALFDIGSKPKTEGSASGAIHRGWINLMKLKPGDNEHAVLAACEQGEDSAVATYVGAMAAPLPEELSELISTQYQVVKATHDRIRTLRDAADKR